MGIVAAEWCLCLTADTRCGQICISKSECGEPGERPRGKRRGTMSTFHLSGICRHVSGRWTSKAPLGSGKAPQRGTCGCGPGGALCWRAPPAVPAKDKNAEKLAEQPSCFFLFFCHE